MSVEVRVVCPVCEGDGLDDEGMFECYACHGEKSLPATLSDPGAVLRELLTARLAELTGAGMAAPGFVLLDPECGFPMGKRGGYLSVSPDVFLRLLAPEGDHND